jgi:serine/threonine protein kinase
MASNITSEDDLQDLDWADRGAFHVTFAQGEKLPLEEVSLLGHGANGPVYSTIVKNIPLAWKRIYCRQRVQLEDLREIDIIKRLRHTHIIRLAGSYTQEPYLGILLYPVAQSDLATFLVDVDYFLTLKHTSTFGYTRGTSEYVEHLHRIEQICGNIQSQSLSAIIRSSTSKLWESLGCTASAIDYLHRHKVRHKDLKPLNILLSRNGLWVTDFGQSTDFSNFSDSATQGFERGTLKYRAPEVAAFERTGRSADIFSLGCIFFEIVGLQSYTLLEQKEMRLAMDGSFQNNLDAILESLETFGSTSLDYLPMSLVRQMISRDPKDRPEASTVCKTLRILQAFSAFEPELFSHISCTHHDSDGQYLPPASATGVEEITVVIGNTCQGRSEKFVMIEGSARHRYPSVYFVECSHTEYFESVMFFKVSILMLLICFSGYSYQM